MGLSRQEYWSGLPFPSPGKLPNPGIEPTSPALAGEFFTTEPPTCLFLKAPSRVPEKHLFLLYWLCQSLWLCRSQQTWTILKETGIPDHMTCLLRNLYAGQEATVTTGHGTTDWFQIGKGVRQGCILSPCLFNFYAEYSMRNAGLEEVQAGIRLQGEISITSDMQMIPPLWQKVKKN